MIFLWPSFPNWYSWPNWSILKAWNRLLYDDRPDDSLANGEYSKGESGALRLIRITCKVVQTHGCEKSGQISDFYIFLCEEIGFSNVPLNPFQGNWFNVLFCNGGILCFLYDNLKHFFESAKDERKLLKTVQPHLQGK